MILAETSLGTTPRCAGPEESLKQVSSTSLDIQPGGLYTRDFASLHAPLLQGDSPNTRVSTTDAAFPAAPKLCSATKPASLLRQRTEISKRVLRT